MAIKAYRASNDTNVLIPRGVSVFVAPDGTDGVEVAIAASSYCSTHVTMPESEWRRLCRKSCGAAWTQAINGSDGYCAEIKGDIIEMTTPSGAVMSHTVAEWTQFRDRCDEFECEPQSPSGWLPGPPTETQAGLCVAELRGVACKVATLKNISAGRVDFHDGTSYKLEDISAHLFIPDPPAPKPIPEPPKWVRVRTAIESGGRPCRVGWGFNDKLSYCFIPDDTGILQAGHKESSFIQIAE